MRNTILDQDDDVTLTYDAYRKHLATWGATSGNGLPEGGMPPYYHIQHFSAVWDTALRLYPRLYENFSPVVEVRSGIWMFVTEKFAVAFGVDRVLFLAHAGAISPLSGVRYDAAESWGDLQDNVNAAMEKVR